MAGGGRGEPCHFLGLGVLEFSQRSYLPPRGGVATDFRHPMVGMAASQPGHFQRSPPPAPPTRRLCMTLGGLHYLGIKEASAFCIMYPYNCSLCNIIIQSKTSGDTAPGVPLAFIHKKNL